MLPCSENDLYELKNNHKSCVALSLADLYDSGVTTVAGCILLAILVEELLHKINLFGVLLAACACSRNLGYRHAGGKERPW